MRITNRLGLPDAIVRAVTNDEYTRGESDISVSQLISPPRLTALWEQHDNEIEEDVSERIWALLGQLMHALLERAGDDALTEERLYSDRLGWRFSGQFDRVVLVNRGSDTYEVNDYKLTSAWSVQHGGKESWTQQLNLYCLLLREHGFRVVKAGVVAFLRDWRRNDALRYQDYPQHQVARVPIDVWDDEAQELYLASRIRAHQATRGPKGVLPDCTPEERWQQPTKFAVMKAGRKSALRLLDSLDEAKAWVRSEGFNPTGLKAINIVERPGENTRCEGYCGVAPFCSQWKGIKEESSA